MVQKNGLTSKTALYYKLAALTPLEGEIIRFLQDVRVQLSGLEQSLKQEGKQNLPIELDRILSTNKANPQDLISLMNDITAFYTKIGYSNHLTAVDNVKQLAAGLHADPEIAMTNPTAPAVPARNYQKIPAETQTRLNLLGYPKPLTADGILGPQTAAALKWFRDNFKDQEPSIAAVPNMDDVTTAKVVNNYYEKVFGGNKTSAVVQLANRIISRGIYDEDDKNFFIIMVYGRWGSELYTTANTLSEAMVKAQKASEKDPKNEYCVEIEPGGFDNPLFKGGKQIAGL